MRLVLTLALLACTSGAALAQAPGRLVVPIEKPNRLPNGAGEVIMTEVVGQQTRERTLVEGLVPEAVGQPIESAIYDLDGDGKAEVVARIKGPKSCDEKGVRCRTLVIKNGANGWVKLLDRKAQRVEVGDLGFGGMRSVIFDARETYNWDGFAYRIDVGAAGAAVSFQDAPANFRSPLMNQFGAGAVKLAARTPSLTVKVAQAAVKEDGTRVVIARLEGPGACGPVYGCPWRILRVKGSAYEAISEGVGSAKMAILPVTRGGYRDVMVATPRGWAVYGWGGTRYVIAENVAEGAK